MTDASLADTLRKAQVLLEAALRRLEQRAERDEGVSRRLGALQPEPVAAFLCLTGQGGGELHLLATREALRVQDAAAPAGFGYALELPLSAARFILEEVEHDEEAVDATALGLTALGSGLARELFTQTRFAFEIEITTVPELGTLVLRCTLGGVDIDRSEFKLTLDYDDVLDAREQQLAPHHLFMAGKMRIDGDVAKAMVLGMTLAELE
jgi:hypothetical protein